MFTGAFMDGIKTFLDGWVAYAQYTANGSDITVPIVKTELIDGRLAITFQIDDPETVITVTQTRLYDAGNHALATKDETINLEPGQGILYRFILSIEEIHS